MLFTSLESIIAIGSFAMGVGSSLLASLRWYREAQRREYAAERDFQHLKRDYELLSKMVAELDEKSDKLAASIVEMRGAISVLLKRSKPVPD